MAAVVFENVNKYYDKNIHAIKDVNLSINDKEFVVLVGPSGCGKSTLLRMIAGLEDLSEGRLLIDDKVVNDVPPKDRDIAMVFQNYALYPHMTVFQNMAFGLKLRKFPEKEIKARVNEAAELLGLSEYLERKPKALSGGQRQRVAVGRAIVRKPKVFLFDEPLSNLDAKLRVQMRIEISRLHQKLKTTMVYVTHDQVEAMTMGERIVVLKDGVIQQVDSPLNLYNHPDNVFTAGFIGSPAMNFLKGSIVDNGELAFQTDDIKIGLNTSFKSRLADYSGKPVLLGIRPEHLELSREPTEFTAVIDVIEPMGADVFSYLHNGRTSLTLRTTPETSLKPDDKISLKCQQDSIHFFDSDTNQAII